jgi:hypothetical protein
MDTILPGWDVFAHFIFFYCFSSLSLSVFLYSFGSGVYCDEMSVVKSCGQTRRGVCISGVDGNTQTQPMPIRCMYGICKCKMKGPKSNICKSHC